MILEDYVSYTIALQEKPISFIEELMKRFFGRLTIILPPVYFTQVYTDQYSGDPLYHTAGLVTGLTGRALDWYSTVYTVEKIHEADEKGIVHGVRETNFLLPDKPRIKDFFKPQIICMELAMMAAYFALPATGVGSLSLGGAACLNNMIHAKRLSRAIEIHDKECI